MTTSAECTEAPGPGHGHDAPRRRRRQYPDRLRRLRRRRARASTGASRPRPSGRPTRSARSSTGCSSCRTSTSTPIDGVCLSSTVPPLVREYERFAERYVAGAAPGRRPRRQDRHSRSSYDNPHEVGPDRIVNAVAAQERYGCPVHRRRLRHVDELRRRLARGRVRRRRARARDRGLDGRAVRAGGAPRQGRLRRAALGDREDAPWHGLQSGLVYGFAGQVDGIVAAHARRARRQDARVIATGGLADLIAPHSADDRARRP